MLESSIEIGAEIFFGLVRKAYSGLKGFEQERDFEKIATKKYIDGLVKRNNTIKVLTMNEPRPLESLYVRANILKGKITADQGDTAEELEKFFDRDRRDFGASRETVDGESIVNKLQRFIVLGKPGAGKTTYLRFLTLMMLKQNSQIVQRKLPIFITLREYADTNLGLLDFIVKQFQKCGFQYPYFFVERILEAGDCLLLFDGLDEVSQQADQSGIIQQIKDFCEEHPENQFVISCRVAAYNRWFNNFNDVEMADFNQKQKENFIQNWFHDEPKIARNCWAKLEESPQLTEMASVPLLLTLLCIAYNRRKSFPENRAELYEEAIDALLRDWDATRDITRDEVYKHLSQKYKKSMFARIAWGTFKENMYFIPERILTKQIEQYIKNLPGFKPEELVPDSYAVLKAIEAQHGIFVERAKKVHSFAHLTFQEYFTAKYIVDNAHVFDEKGKNSLMDLVEDHLYDDKWLEVFILTAEMQDNADQLLFLMQRKNRELLREMPELEVLLRTIYEAFKPGFGNYALVGRASTAMFLAFARAGFHDDDNILFSEEIDPNQDLLHGLNQKLRSDPHPNLRGARKLVFDFARGLALDLAQSFNSPHHNVFKFASDPASARSLCIEFGINLAPLEAYRMQLNNLDIHDIKRISNYQKGNLWLVKCLNSGAYVSQKMRERVLAGLFKPEGE